MRACEVVLWIQDTTELDFNGQTITVLADLRCIAIARTAWRALCLHVGTRAEECGWSAPRHQGKYPLDRRI
ncbi:transposase (fragment) [Cupriavidus taiwanensis]|uniref:Transposase n=1 Tax=Cupriavidus taiwanensis TaxID=164546 RepID=A0A375JAX6_9BURK